MAGMDFMFENMLSKMTGMKPEELKMAVQSTISAIHQAANDIAEMKQRLITIQNHLGVEDATGTNGNRKLPSPDNSNIQH